MSCSAHSGKTDANGGHWDHSIGEYHYHHGYEAHQHINGRCPYNFDDQTNHDGGSSSGSSTDRIYKRSSSTSDMSKTSLSIGTSTSEVDDDFNILEYFFIPAIIFAIWFISHIYKKHKAKMERLAKEEAEKQKYTKLYGHKNILELVNIPDDTEIGPDNLPREKDSVNFWGEKYTVYISDTGSCFHAKCGCSGARRPSHIYNCMHRKSACARCRPYSPDLSWYEEYLKIQSIKKKYGIIEEQPSTCTDQIADDTPQPSNPLLDEYISIDTRASSRDVIYKTIFANKYIENELLHASLSELRKTIRQWESAREVLLKSNNSSYSEIINNANDNIEILKNLFKTHEDFDAYITFKFENPYNEDYNGNINPYNGKEITCEEDYDEYFMMAIEEYKK